MNEMFIIYFKHKKIFIQRKIEANLEKVVCVLFKVKIN